MSLVRNSRTIATRISCIRRSAATTSTSSGGTDVRPSGASTNLSQASRSADGTDMAMKDAKQRTNTSDPAKPQSSSKYIDSVFMKSLYNLLFCSPGAGKSSTPWGTIGLGIILAAGGYYAYMTYINKPQQSKSAHQQPAK